MCLVEVMQEGPKPSTAKDMKERDRYNAAGRGDNRHDAHVRFATAPSHTLRLDPQATQTPHKSV